MTALTDFLLARIDEDEASARATEEEGGWYGPDPGWLAAALDPHRVLDEPMSRSAAHIIRQSPVRVLAECASKRAVVSICHVPDPHTADEAGDGCTECAVLYTLALPYADHPDYDATWRP